jgi:hypothetical protein
VNVKVSIRKGLLYFLSGHAVGAIVVAIFSRVYDRSWTDGLVVLGLSAPITIIYLLALWCIGNWQFFSRTFAGMAVSGLLTALYPVLSGTFPIYTLRLGLGVPLLLGEFGLLALVSAVFARFEKYSV